MLAVRNLKTALRKLFPSQQHQNNKTTNTESVYVKLQAIVEKN